MFVTNIRSILLYAIVGTIFNFLIIGGCLVLKEVELFSDTFVDPVFLDNFVGRFWFEATQMFQFLWPTVIVQMDTEVTTNVTTSQVFIN